MSGLEDARDDYADENLPVFLLLGLVSSLRRLDALPPPEVPAGSAPEPLPGSGRFLYLVLGLIAFRRHLLAALTPFLEAAPPGGPGDEPADTAPSRGASPQPPSLRELLR